LILRASPKAAACTHAILILPDAPTTAPLFDHHLVSPVAAPCVPRGTIHLIHADQRLDIEQATHQVPGRPNPATHMQILKRVGSQDHVADRIMP
jgi:hypothetical protein